MEHSLSRLPLHACTLGKSADGRTQRERERDEREMERGRDRESPTFIQTEEETKNHVPLCSSSLRSLLDSFHASCLSFSSFICPSVRLLSFLYLLVFPPCFSPSYHPDSFLQSFLVFAQSGQTQRSEAETSGC